VGVQNSLNPFLVFVELNYESGGSQRNAFYAEGRNTGIRDRMAGSDIQRFTHTFDASGNRVGTVDLKGSCESRPRISTTFPFEDEKFTTRCFGEINQRSDSENPLHYRERSSL